MRANTLHYIAMKLMPTLIMVLASAFFLSACATAIKSPQAPGTLAVIILPVPDVQIVQTSARQEEGGVYVEGKIQRVMPRRRVIQAGHVDIAVVDEKGKTLRQIPTKYSPEIIPRSHGMKSSFTALIPMMPPPGSFISVKFHSGDHES